MLTAHAHACRGITLTELILAVAAGFGLAIWLTRVL